MMNSDKLYLRICSTAACVAMLVWWCVLYPELCFPQDTYEVVYETEEIQTHPRILQAEDEQIIVKSRLLEWLNQMKK